MSGGFYRIFFQSHVFVLTAFVFFFIMAISMLNKKSSKVKILIQGRQFILLFILLLIFFTTSLISMSRSNWVGFIISGILILIYSFWRYKIKGLISYLSLFFVLLGSSYLLMIGLVNFPYPKIENNVQTAEIFSERVSEMKNEAGVSSRWNLLPKLKDGIKASLIIGSGFGSTITYVSDDPRVRSDNRDGVYTTFALEWGWLDVWYKLGILGFIFYLYFLIVVIVGAFKESLKADSLKRNFIIAIIVSVIALAAINFFSPYLNHPLGIGLILYLLFLLEMIIIDKDIKTD